MPKPVTSPLPPAQVKTIEELYLIGLRAEQFHDPGIDPEPYWEEALRRDPGDVRVNTALGINYYKKARYAEAEQHFRKALERLTDNYTTPKDAEPIYYLGLTLKAQGRFDEAYKYLYKATWNLPWRAAGYYGVAEIATMRGDFTAALDFVDRSLDNNALNIRALNLKAAVLRHMGRTDEALRVLATAHRRSDPLDVRSMAERWLTTKDAKTRSLMTATMNDHPATAAETAAEYLNAGLWQDGRDVLLESVADAPDKAKIQPMVYYYLGYFAEKLGQPRKATEYYAQAMKMPSEYVFPFQGEEIEVLRAAMRANPHDARAPYYLGNLLFDWQPAEAAKMWETSAALDPSLPIVHRNLAISWWHRKSGHSLDKAIAQLELAVASTPKYAKHFAELDELYEAAGVAPEKRLALLEKNQDVVVQRDDSLAREVGLLVSLGKYDDAIQRLTGREFAVWEGGNLNVADNWTDAHMLRGRKLLEAKKAKEALAEFQAALEIPSNLPSEGIDTSSREPEADYWMGCAYAAMGDAAQAKKSWQKSADVKSGPQPERRRRRAGLSPRDLQAYYQALSLRKLGQADKATVLLHQLMDWATQALQGGPAKPDLSAPLDTLRMQRFTLATAHYAAGLGYLGLNDQQKAKEEFTKVLEASPDYVGAKAALAELR